MDKLATLKDTSKNTWEKGIWYSKDKEKIPISEMDRDRLLATTFHLLKHTVSHLHSRYFFSLNNNLNMSNVEDAYKNFTETILEMQGDHPIWKYVVEELKKRNLYDFVVRKIESL